MTLVLKINFGGFKKIAQLRRYTIYLSQKADFKVPVKIGDTVTAEVEVLEKKDQKKIIRLRTIVKNQLGEMVVDSEAVVMK